MLSWLLLLPGVPLTKWFQFNGLFGWTVSKQTCLRLGQAPCSPSSELSDGQSVHGAETTCEHPTLWCSRYSGTLDQTLVSAEFWVCVRLITQSLWPVSKLELDLGQEPCSGLDGQCLTASEQMGPLLPRSLRGLLDGEMEHSAALRQEVDSLKRKAVEQEERHTMKVQALAR